MKEKFKPNAHTHAHTYAKFILLFSVDTYHNRIIFVFVVVNFFSSFSLHYSLHPKNNRSILSLSQALRNVLFVSNSILTEKSLKQKKIVSFTCGKIEFKNE